MGFTRTPKEITSDILKFCHQISNGNEPLYLKVTPSQTSMRNECFQNVRNQISHNGGSMQYGYRIWEWGNVMVEAEFHSVWVSDNGNFVDVSPSDEDIVLFLPTELQKYTGVPIDNIRHVLIDDRIIHEFVEVCNQISELRIKTGQTSNPVNHVATRYLLKPLVMRQSTLYDMIHKKYFLMDKF